MRDGLWFCVCERERVRDGLWFCVCVRERVRDGLWFVCVCVIMSIIYTDPFTQVLKLTRIIVTC